MAVLLEAKKITVYHGCSKIITTPKPELAKRGEYGFGFYVTDDYEVAYKFGMEISYFYLRPKKVLSLDWHEVHRWMEAHAKTPQPGKYYEGLQYAKWVTETITAEGYDTLRVKFKLPPSMMNPSGKASYYVVFDMGTLTSFDPHATKSKPPVFAKEGPRLKARFGKPRPAYESLTEAAGLCFKYVFDWAVKNIEDGHKSVVHGEVENPHLKGHRYWHAWIEKDGRIYDWQTEQAGKQPMRYFKWYALMKPKDMKRYTAKEVVQKCFKTKHQGPWHPYGESLEETVEDWMDRPQWFELFHDRFDIRKGYKIVSKSIEKLPSF